MSCFFLCLIMFDSIAKLNDVIVPTDEKSHDADRYWSIW